MKTALPDPADIHAGLRLRTLRRLAGKTQSQLGDALGVTFQQVQKYERGTNRLSSSALQRASIALGQPVEAFFEGLPRPNGLDDEETPRPTFYQFAASDRGALELAELYLGMNARRRASLLSVARAIGSDEPMLEVVARAAGAAA